jgi:hypothetical protein
VVPIDDNQDGGHEVKQVTTIWFEDEERRALEAASRSVGVGLDGDDREYVERTMRGIAQPGDVVSRERLASGVIAVRTAIARVGVEASLNYWRSVATTPGQMTAVEAAMAAALVTARQGQRRDLEVGLDVLESALDLADPKPTLEKWNGA